MIRREKHTPKHMMPSGSCFFIMLILIENDNTYNQYKNDIILL